LSFQLKWVGIELKQIDADPFGLYLVLNHRDVQVVGMDFFV